MQKVFDEVYSLDKRCYDEFGLNEDILMENAAQSISREIQEGQGSAGGPGVRV